MEDMPELEKCFIVKILIYSISPCGVVSNLYKSLNESPSKMFLNLHLCNYFGFYIALNTVRVITRWVVLWAEEISTYSWSRFYTVN